LGYFLRGLAAAERDPVGAKARPSWPQKQKQRALLALDSGSLCGAAKGGRKRPACAARGWARGSALISLQGRMPCQRNPAARSAPALRAGATPRVCSLWLLSLAQARESDSAARKAD